MRESGSVWARGVFATLSIGIFVTLSPAAETPTHEPVHACGNTCDQFPLPVSGLRPLDRVGFETRGLRGAGGLEDGSVIDILVVYTPQASAGNGGQSGIESLILDGLDEVHDLRDAHKADLVMMVVSNGDVCEIVGGMLSDCNANGYPDFAEQDFNRNGVPDECDIAGGDSDDLDGDGDTLEALRFDFVGAARFVDDPATADTGIGSTPIVDAGAYEYQASVPCVADLAEPFGILDLSDITAFVSSFLAGCP